MSDGTTGEGVLSKKWAKYLNCRLQGRVGGGRNLFVENGWSKGSQCTHFFNIKGECCRKETDSGKQKGTNAEFFLIVANKRSPLHKFPLTVES